MKRLLVGALASGGLLAAAFPPLDQGWCAWIALVPLLRVLPGAAPGRAFGAGWCTGAVMYAAVLSWLVSTLTHFTSLGIPLAVGAYLAAVAVLACYVGLFGALVALAARGGGRWWWLASPAWALTEWLRGWLLIGFPWAPLGATQHDCLPVVQLAALAGVHGISALLVLGNAAVAAWARDEQPWVLTLVTGTVLAASIAWGNWRIETLERDRPAGTLRVGLVQGAVRQDRKWHPAYRDTILAHFVELSRGAGAERPAVIVWPETATPSAFEDDPRGHDALARLTTELGVPLVFGSMATERQHPDRPVRRNRVYLLEPGGSVAGTYDKQVPVPFGEYVPYARFLPFLRPIIAGEGAIRAAGPQLLLDIGGARLGVLVCYEAVVPAVALGQVGAGATVLLNLSNDAWFAGTAATAQLVAQARLRAVESGVPLVRVANSGVSAVVASTGRVLWAAPTPGWVWYVGDVSWPAGTTPYARWGDVVVWLSLGAWGAAGVRAAASRARPRRPRAPRRG